MENWHLRESSVVINSSVSRKAGAIESGVGMKDSHGEWLGEVLINLTGCLARF